MAQSIKLGSNLFLDAQGVNGYKGSLSSSDNLDNMYMRHHSGIYYIGADVQNAPANYCMMVMIGTGESNASIAFQLVQSYSKIYIRRRTGSGSTYTWSAWYEFTGTQVS